MSNLKRVQRGKSAEDYFEEGKKLASYGRFEESLFSIERAIQLDSNNADYHNG